MTLFLGKPISYWQEAHKRIEENRLDSLLDDFIIANAKVKYYEQLFDDIAKYRNAAESMKK